MTVAGPVMRARVRVEGTVQGVGFRPYVYRLAGELRLDGWVLNDFRGVLLEVEGTSDVVDEFLARLAPEAPPLAIVERLMTESCAPSGERGFVIRASVAAAGSGAGAVEAPVSADTATCADCLRELQDPADRRYRYPFINCTNCGPRFTIIAGVPYDRPSTTMAGFAMCPRCQAEYDDPNDRRFHAQPNACPACGPSLELLAARGGRGKATRGQTAESADPLKAAAAALRDGAILAVKGIGGFHLACRADSEDAVARLRARKHREDKPFALMACDLAAAERLVVLGRRERELLVSAQRPIVLAVRRAVRTVAPSVAPGTRELGVMLPYSPLHHLLLADFLELAADALPALVMTSGNVSDEPIAFTDRDALQRLEPIADLMLVHDRPIQTRTDDSVVRVVHLGAGRPRTAFLRRSRGYVPASTSLRGGTPVPLLACGAEQKNTFCVAKGARAWVGHHIGDLENYETLRSFSEGVKHFERLFDVHPEVVVHDLHPEYLSTKYALERPGVRLIGVQHHHAHLAACLAEHELAGPAVGAIFDGTGYGPDGTIWGGEILFGDLAGFERVGALAPVRLPGGARAIREPWRMACAWLTACSETEAPLPGWLRAAGLSPSIWDQVAQLARSGLASPVTTSMGRLFDAVAALCGLRTSVNYEGQAAIELEAACDPHETGCYPISVYEGEAEALVIDPREAVLAVLRDRRQGVRIGQIAARFHAGVAAATVDACARAAAARGVELVVMSGGVFQNEQLLEAVAVGLEARGLRGITPSLLPANDGGISFGQVAVVAHQLGAT
ncbi:MAG: carbamoyltransferase HypF [Solirubrobacteraceae bacterium]